MRIAIIGAGRVGSSLGIALSRVGHEVCFGVRDPASPQVAQTLLACRGQARALAIADAAAFGEVVALAVSKPALSQVIKQAGNLEGKILVDCTNRIAASEPGGFASSAEEVAALAKNARVVKAFNTIGAEHYQAPRFGGEAASMLLAGNDDEAVGVLSQLATDLGFEPVKAGPLSVAPLLEALAKLWVTMARSGGREFAFRVIR